MNAKTVFKKEEKEGESCHLKLNPKTVLVFRFELKLKLYESCGVPLEADRIIYARLRPVRRDGHIWDFVCVCFVSFFFLCNSGHIKILQKKITST